MNLHAQLSRLRRYCVNFVSSTYDRTDFTMPNAKAMNMSAWNWKSFLFLLLFIAVWLLHLQINDLNHIFSKSNKLNNCKWCGLKTRGVWDKMTTCPKIKFSWFLFVLFCVQNLCCTALKNSLIRFSDRVVGEWDWCVRGDFSPWILHFFSI